MPQDTSIANDLKTAAVLAGKRIKRSGSETVMKS
jgi:hypothetical protein